MRVRSVDDACSPERAVRSGSRPACEACPEALGVRNVPVVAKGEQYVFGQNLEDVAEFVGLQGTGHTPLPPPELRIRRWMKSVETSPRR